LNPVGHNITGVQILIVRYSILVLEALMSLSPALRPTGPRSMLELGKISLLGLKSI
jgi:hypothetical protein